MWILELDGVGPCHGPLSAFPVCMGKGPGLGLCLSLTVVIKM